MPTFIRLTDYKDSDTKEQQFANPANRHTANQKDFSKIPGSPIAYWVSESIKKIYESNYFSKYTISDGQNKTGENDKYLRNIWEVDNKKIIDHTDYKWIFYAKGGEFRRWYGNIDYLIDWSEESRQHYRKDKIARLIPEYMWFRKGISWSLITSGENVGFRVLNENSTFDVAGSSIFFNENEINDFNYFLGFLNSKIVGILLKISNPTVSLQVKDIRSLPIIFPKNDVKENNLKPLVQQCIDLSREEWDSRETSWDFKQNELILHKSDDGKIASAYAAYCDYWREKFEQLHANEEELNRLFIDIYGLQDELTPDVALEDITILKSESRIENGALIFNADEIARQFVSYAVGCMFGRYALDREGLVVANMDQPYPTDTPFAIDDDNIIPVLEEEVFADDIAARFERFVGVAFGEERVGENLRWVEEALGMSIRKYFYGEFYKDHVKRYKKRPIYWLIQSPKKGFQALIYMHRYQSDTMARVQTMYLREYLTKLESLIEHHNSIATNPSSSAKDAKDAAKLASKLEGKHRDALDFDRGDMSRIAAEQITIDLDDGVKVNYQKFKGVLPDIGLSKGED